jgi:hypothetical protein
MAGHRATAKNRRDWHLGQVRSVTTDRQTFWKICGWLLAEAIRHDAVPAATAVVQAELTKLRQRRKAT